MLWKREVAIRGILWSAIWNSPSIRQITLGIRNVVWFVLHPINIECPIQRQMTPPRIPKTRPFSKGLYQYVTSLWKN